MGRPRVAGALVSLCVLLAMVPVAAAGEARKVPQSSSHVTLAELFEWRESMLPNNKRPESSFGDARAREGQRQPATTTRERSMTRKILGAAVGGVGGFFGGGYLGAAIDGECGGCDDPGLKGALIGAPIGAAAGSVLGYKFLF
jgi:hypothetical protein